MAENEKETVLPIDSDIISANSEILKDQLIKLIDAAQINITLDIAKVNIIDSTGIGVLIAARNSIVEKGGVFKVINASEDIWEMFQIMRLNQHFAVAKA